jgi:hypothetical protein
MRVRLAKEGYQGGTAVLVLRPITSTSITGRTGHSIDRMKLSELFKSISTIVHRSFGPDSDIVASLGPWHLHAHPQRARIEYQYTSNFAMLWFGWVEWVPVPNGIVLKRRENSIGSTRKVTQRHQLGR